MTFKELPTSLIEASKNILDESVDQYAALHERFMLLGLQRFGVKREAQLNEIDRKALHSWVQIQLFEACTCGMKSEDHMPGDSVFYNSSGEMKKELDETDDTESSDSEELDEVLNLTKGSEEDATKRAIDDFIKSDSARFEGKSKKERIKMAIAAVKSARGISKNEEVEKPESELKEAIAIEPEDVATNSAVAVGNSMEAMPKHADVIKDSVPTEGKVEYRLLLQYTTNGDTYGGAPHKGTHIYPAMSLPGANTIDALKNIVEGMPFYNKVVEKALEAAKEAETKK